MAGTQIDDLAAELAAGLAEYSEEVTETIKRSVDEVAAATVNELKQTSPKRTGAYAKDWANKKAYEDTRSKRKTVYNKKHYQLTHLLEYGHAKRGGGRVDPKPHIKAAEEKAAKEFESKIRRGL